MTKSDLHSLSDEEFGKLSGKQYIEYMREHNNKAKERVDRLKFLMDQEDKKWEEIRKNSRFNRSKKN
jgi:uncharacterized protein YwgA